jgi:hypothetical protein
MTFKFLKRLMLIAALALPAVAVATYPTLILKNQFGEQSNNVILGGSGSVTGVFSANTIASNLTGSTAAALGNTYAAVSAKLVPTMLLTGFTSGAGTVAGTDTVLQGIQKLAGNTQNKAFHTYTSAAGAGGGATEAFTVTGLVSTDTILSVTQKTPGANSLPLLGYSTLATDALTGIYSADPGAGSVIVVTVLR